MKEVASKARQAGLSFRKSGGLLPTPTVHKILRHRIYTGEFSWNGRIYTGKYEPIISKNLFNRVQDVLDGRGTSSPSRAWSAAATAAAR